MTCSIVCFDIDNKVMVHWTYLSFYFYMVGPKCLRIPYLRDIWYTSSTATKSANYTFVVRPNCYSIIILVLLANARWWGPCCQAAQRYRSTDPHCDRTTALLNHSSCVVEPKYDDASYPSIAHYRFWPERYLVFRSE